MDRLVAHIYLFEDTAYELIGFTEKDDGGDNMLAAVLRQAFVRLRKEHRPMKWQLTFSGLALSGLTKKRE